MANRFGQAYGLTLMSPVLGGDDSDGVPHDTALRRELAALNTARESPFASVPSTHLARWVLMDDARFEGIPAKVDHLASKYLLFTSNFDGGAKGDDEALDDYLDSLRQGAGEVMQRLYRHCAGFPGVQDGPAFRAYCRRCQVTTSFLFGAYPQASVADVLRALATQRRMGAFVAEQQANRAAPERVQKAFAAFMAELRSAPLPRPGTL